MPVNDFVFEEAGNIFEFNRLEETAYNKLKEAEGEAAIYVTGLSMLLVAVLKAAQRLNMSLDLYHFNNETEGYEVQRWDPQN
jgi:hypothetical protein